MLRPCAHRVRVRVRVETNTHRCLNTLTHPSKHAATYTRVAFKSTNARPHAYGNGGVCLDLGAPHSWFPQARAMKRKIICHVGPTNSGKTHTALEALASARCGMYCGPLRLLAWEVYEKINSMGIPCKLVTGQEVQDPPNSKHMSCTVEMAHLSKVYDVAVIDEAQLIGDSTRGWAWTRAVLGVQAVELHLCGSDTFLPAIKQLCEVTGDAIDIHRYERLTPLVAEVRPLGSLKNLREGDCIIAFSRRMCYMFKSKIEKLSRGKIRCCVVYGGLPPDTRREQARLFNNAGRGGPTTVLVATDAIGMGLNLSIGRVIFSSLTKFDGERSRPVSVAELKQIAGRAGRYNGRFSKGAVTCLQTEDMQAIQVKLNAKDAWIKSLGLAPTLEQLKVLAAYTYFGADEDLVTSFRSYVRENDVSDTLVPEYEDDWNVFRAGSTTTSMYEGFSCYSDFVNALRDFVRERYFERCSSKKNRKAKLQPLPPNLSDLIQPEEILSAASLWSLLRSFPAAAAAVKEKQKGLYFMCDINDTLTLAKTIEHIPLRFEDRFLFCLAPVKIERKQARRAFQSFAEAFAASRPVHLRARVDEHTVASTPEELLELESLFSVFELYIWLGQRFEASFVDMEVARQQLSLCGTMIEQALADLAPRTRTHKRRKAKDILYEDDQELADMSDDFISDIDEAMAWGRQLGDEPRNSLMSAIFRRSNTSSPEKVLSARQLSSLTSSKNLNDLIDVPYQYQHNDAEDGCGYDDLEQDESEEDIVQRTPSHTGTSDWRKTKEAELEWLHKRGFYGSIKHLRSLAPGLASQGAKKRIKRLERRRQKDELGRSWDALFSI